MQKKNYYTRCFSNIKSDMKSTWQNINSVLNKTKVKKLFPDKFKTAPWDDNNFRF